MWDGLGMGLQNNNQLSQGEFIINPNLLENTLTDMITNYINEIEDTNDERRLQIAIEASLNDNHTEIS